MERRFVITNAFLFFTARLSTEKQQRKKQNKKEKKMMDEKSENLWKIGMSYEKAKMKKQSLNHPF